MKTKTKTTNLIRAAGLCALSMSWVQNARSEGQFAVLKTSEACQINVPENGTANSYYFSHDCQTAYILPGRTIRMTVSEPVLGTGARESTCRDFQLVEARTQKTRQQIESLQNYLEQLTKEQTDGLNMDQAKLHFDKMTVVQKNIEFFEKQIAKDMAHFDQVAALTGTITVSSDQAEQVALFSRVNPLTVVEPLRPVRIVPAVIDGAVLSFRSNQISEDYHGKTILKINFPGRAVPSVDGVDAIESSSIAMNGGASGQVTISASAYCATKSVSPDFTNKQILANSLALNLAYKVRAQAGARLQIAARIETKDFVRVLSNTIVNGKFSRNDVVNQIVNGGLSSGLMLSIDDKGQKLDLSDLYMSRDEDQTNPIAGLVGKVISNFVSNAESKLIQLGILEKLDAVKAKEVAAGSEDIVVGTRTVCSSSSSWFGFLRKEHCSSSPIYVRVDRSGISEYLKTGADNSVIEQSVQFESEQTISLAHNSTFVFVQE